MEKRYLQLNDVNAYKVAFNLSNYIWNVIVRWDYFAKKTVGDQFTRAADSISANIAEGFGRYNKKEKVYFYRVSYGSINETLDWNEKAKIRGLLEEDEYRHVFDELKRLPKEVSSYKFHKSKIINIAIWQYDNITI